MKLCLNEIVNRPIGFLKFRIEIMGFLGQIPEFQNVSIDNFLEENGNHSSTCFFLTHCHSDHTQGLKEIVPFLKEKGYYLYCSPISRLILLNSNYGFEPDEIQEVEGSKLIEVPGNEENTKLYSLTVSAIPAGHCPGSIMFLLQDAKKTVLFTGDFRILKEDLHKFIQLKDYLNGSKTIDKIYFDATFFTQDYLKFPERSECTQMAVNIIREKFAENPNVHVHIYTGAQGGYEDLFLKLANEFKCKIHVGDSYFKKFSQISCISKILTKDPNNTQLHYYQYGSYNHNVIPKPYFQLRLTAMRFRWKNSVKPKFSEKRGRTYHVCYPTHSSFSEVRFFLDSLSHKSREPICSTARCELEENVSRYFIAARNSQRIFRGYTTRKHNDMLKEKATCIQKNWRAFLGRMAYEDLLLERFEELCRSRYKTMAITIQKHWKGYWVRSKIFSYYKLKSWLEFVNMQNIHFKCFSKRYRAAQNKIEIEQREEEAKEWILYILFKLHHLLRTHQISGIYSLPKTRSLSDIEKMLNGLKYKDFMKFYNSCKADILVKKAKPMPPYIFQHCKYAAHFEREWYQHKMTHKDSYIESSIPKDRFMRYESREDDPGKDHGEVKPTLCICCCSHCTIKTE